MPAVHTLPPGEGSAPWEMAGPRGRPVHNFGGVDELDTQIIQGTLKNREFKIHDFFMENKNS